MVAHSPLSGVSARQGRYLIKYVLKHAEETKVMTAIAIDTQAHDQKVVLKRWECTDIPVARRAKELVYYEKATEPLLRLHHPLIPPVLDRFVEGKHYYLVLKYIDGESLEELMQKLLRPLSEREVLGYLNNILNILIALDQQRPPFRHFDISPSNIIIENARWRAMLTGFQVPSPPPEMLNAASNHRTTRKIATSAYIPVKDTPYDHRTCIYMLAACMHHALTNVAPPHYPSFPSARTLNALISAELDAILSRALQEDKEKRYQSYADMQKDVKKLL